MSTEPPRTVSSLSASASPTRGGTASGAEKSLDRSAVIAIACLGMLVVVLVGFVETDPDLAAGTGLRAKMASWQIDPIVVNRLMFGVCVLAVAFVGVSTGPPPRSRALAEAIRRGSFGFLVALTFAAGLTYFYGYRGVVQPEFLNGWDMFHYFIGPKYFDELGYTGLYEATVVAAREDRLGVTDTDLIRDLNTYEFVSQKTVKDDNEYVKRFSPERWREFKADVAVIYRNQGPYAKKMIRDHGYNGTPVWNFFGSTLANLIPLTYANLTYLALLDILLLLTGFAVITHSYGWRLGLLFCIFYCVIFTSRFLNTGGTFLRQSWMATLAIGIALLHRKRHLAGGGFMALSSLLNIFPVLFSVGIAIKGLVDLVVRRRLGPEHRRFVLGFVATAIVLSGLSLTTSRGLEGYRSFAHQMGQHAEKLTTSRVGFQYLFVFHGEVTLTDTSVSYDTKEKELEGMWPWLPAAMGLGLLVCAIIVCRLDDARACILFGVVAIFLIFSLVQYYWAMMSLLMLLWCRDPPTSRDERGTSGGQLLLFVMAALILLGWDLTRRIDFVNNTLTSALLALYLTYALVYFARTTGRFGSGMEKLRAIVTR